MNICNILLFRKNKFWGLASSCDLHPSYLKLTQSALAI